ncbi:MAG: PAN/Apple domain-containing protein [Thermodesulfobacteriota bacterium]
MLKTKKNGYAATILFIVFALSASSVQAGVKYGMAYGGNRDYSGGDYANHKVANLDECMRKCAEDKKCWAFAYADSVKACALKDRIGKQVRSPGMYGGHKL